MSIKWEDKGSRFYPSDVTTQIDQPPIAVYTIGCDNNGNLFLNKEFDKFEFPYKLYGIEKDFIERVKKTYNNTDSNLGVLLTGVKGTGKSVTCELICNELNLPVVLVNKDYANLVEFLTSFQFPVILFFDEFEKTIDRDSGSSEKFLTIMDGTLKNKYKTLFLLTTNNLHVDNNLLQRPGRIRYLKTFNNLSIEHIEQIVLDKLNNINYKDSVIEFISQLELITVDIVSSIVQETNIHDEPPSKYSDVFNVKKIENKFNVFEIVKNKNGNKLKLFKSDGKVTQFPFRIDQLVYVDGVYIGEIYEIHNQYVITLEFGNDNKRQKKTYKFEPIFSINDIYKNYDAF